MHRADSTINKIPSTLCVSKIKTAALRALPDTTAVIWEKPQCDGRLRGPVINLVRQILLIARLGVMIHNECADFLETLFVERNRL